jgi:hypothetical protein
LADQAEPRSRLAAALTAGSSTAESDSEDVIVPSTPPRAGESQGGTTGMARGHHSRPPHSHSTRNDVVGTPHIFCIGNTSNLYIQQPPTHAHWE